MLAEFTLALGQSDESADALRPLSEALSRALGSGDDMAAGFVALEGTAGGDRVIGVTAYAPDSEGATFNIAVATGFRDEQVGRTLLATLIRHAKRVGIRRVHGEMAWSNRPMHLLAQATGFTVEAVTGDRSRRSLVLSLK